MSQRKHCKAKEPPMVAFPYTSANPGTVMIMNFDACLALATVKRSGRPIYVACSALEADYFLVFNNCYMVNL